MGYKRVFLSLFLAIFVASIAGVAVAQEIGSGGVGGRPAYPREDNDRSKSIFIHTIDPGGSADDGVLLINNTDEEKTLKVYSTDSVVSSGGAFACAQFVDPKDEVGSWIELEKDIVTLEGAGSEVVDFKITVPNNTDVGEHDGCIVVQEEKGEPDASEGIGLSFRNAIRVAILIPGEIEKELEIVEFVSSKKPGKIILTPFIQNYGNVSVDADINTDLSYFFGMHHTSAGGKYPVLRGQVGEWNFEHDRPFWGGFFKADVTATYDSNTDNFIGSENQNIETITYNTIWLFVFPHPLAFAIELLILMVLIYAVYDLRSRMKTRRAIKKDWRTYTVKAGDDIRKLAKATGISWKKLAKANKLKAPYTLNPGDKIKLPIKRKPAKQETKPKPIDVIK